VCAAGGLHGKVLFFPDAMWSAVQDADPMRRAGARANYSCVEWASGRFDVEQIGGYYPRQAMVRLLVSLNATGVVWDSIKTYANGGYYWTDDDWEPPEGGMPTLMLECAVPWAVTERTFFASDHASSTEVELVCEEDRPFTVLFSSWAYFAVFRLGFGSLFTALALYGLRLLRYTLKDRERSFILVVNIVSCGVLGVWLFFIGGFYSLPTMAGTHRDSLIVAFMGEVLCTIMLVTIRWNSVLDSVDKCVKKRYGVYYGLVAVSFAASVIFTVAILADTVRISQVQFQASIVYLGWTFCASTWYLLTARRYYVRLDWLASTSEAEVNEQIKHILKDVVRAGGVLAATCVAIAMLGVLDIMSPVNWSLSFGFYFSCRWALSLFAMQLATPVSKRVKRKKTARAVPARNLISKSSSRVLPASHSASERSRTGSAEDLPRAADAPPAPGSDVPAAPAANTDRPL
jgi:hypothetical protein